MKRSVMPAVFVIVLFLFLPGLVLATVGPSAYLTEQVEAHYSSNGTIDTGTSYSECNETTNPCRYGFLQASVPNKYDVLQDIRINFSSGATENTTLQSLQAFKATLASSLANSKEDVYVNTSYGLSDYGYRDDAYEINSSISSNTNKAPVLQLNATITNWAGGNDLYDNDNGVLDKATNYMNFTLNVTNPSSSVNLGDIQVKIRFDLNTTSSAPFNDSVNITIIPSSGVTGDGNIVDNNADNYYDEAIYDNFALSAGSSALITFNFTLHEEQNYPPNTDSMNLDYHAGTDLPSAWNNKGGRAYYANITTTFTEITIAGKSTKGPIRQGIDMSKQSGAGGNWTIRGLIRNMANESVSDPLTYNLTYWRLYEVNDTGHPVNLKQAGEYNGGSGLNLTPNMERIYTTDSNSNVTTWYDTNNATKPYYASYFDWEVVWNTTNGENQYSYINTTYDLKTLYKIDMDNIAGSQLSGFINPETGGDVLEMNVTSKHTGSANAPAEYFQMLSVIPVNTTDGNFHGAFNVTNTSVYYYNSSSVWVNITGDAGVDLSVTEPDDNGASDGLVNVTITDTSAVTAIGRYLNSTNPDKIRLSYKTVSHKNMTMGDTYSYTGNTTMKTPSGTPLVEPNPTEDITVSVRRLVGWKEMIGYDPANPNLINVTLKVKAYTSNDTDYISGIKFIDYLPNGTDIDGDLTAMKNNATVQYYNSTTDTWTTWTEGSEYTITKNASLFINGNPVTAYEYDNATGDGWKLDDEDAIKVTYQMNVEESGLYSVPLIIAGFDPLTGASISGRAVGVVKVNLPEPMKPLEIRQGEFGQAKRAVVGKSVLWMKDFTVYNPNSRPTPASFEIKTFQDTEKGYATYYNQKGEKIEEAVDFDIMKNSKKMFWETKLNPLETREYELRIFTPPVIEVDRDVEVLEQMEEKKVKIKMDIYLKNFAKEKYKNVVLNLPISYEDILQVRDSFGNRLAFSGGEDSSSIVVGKINGKDIKTVTIIYKQSYPTIIVTPRKEEFRAGKPVGLDILVINGGERVEYPRLEVEIYTPGMNVIDSRIKELESMEPLAKTELTEEYFIPLSAPSGMYLASASFRQDFTTLARGTGNFFVTGGGSETAKAIEIIIIIIAIGIAIYIAYKRIKAVREE